MTVKLDLTPEQEAQIFRRAQQSGLTLDGYLQTLLPQTSTPHHTTEPVPAARPQYDREAMLALLDDLINTDKYGTAEEQQETLTSLKKAIDDDRPSQRRVFGKGYNPA